MSTIALIDTEQSGNWETSAPEIYYVENLIRLIHSPLVPESEKGRLRSQLDEHVPVS
ncbi:hypothetical protein C8A00DRAFT_39003, partial [Chaetomidium leptoderma]